MNKELIERLLRLAAGFRAAHTFPMGTSSVVTATALEDGATALEAADERERKLREALSEIRGVADPVFSDDDTARMGTIWRLADVALLPLDEGRERRLHLAAQPEGKPE